MRKVGDTNRREKSSKGRNESSEEEKGRCRVMNTGEETDREERKPREKGRGDER